MSIYRIFFYSCNFTLFFEMDFQMSIPKRKILEISRIEGLGPKYDFNERIISKKGHKRKLES